MEKIKKLFEENKFYILFFAAVTLIAFLFVPSADDWGWGSSYGLKLLENRFDGYNGRYLGNIFAIALTRMPVLLPFIKSFTITAVLRYIIRYSETDDKSFMFLSASILIIPTSLLTQGFIWTAGFSNYYISALIIIAGFSMITSGRKKSIPELVLILIISVSGQLFMETYTLFAAALSALILVVKFRKEKKADAACIVHFIGCIIGAVIMFTNSAYVIIANGEDKYQKITVGSEEKSFITTCFERLFSDVLYNIVISCLPVLLALLIVSIVLLKQQGKMKGGARAAVAAAFVSMAAFGGLAAYSAAVLHSKDKIFFFVGFTALSILTVCAAAFIKCLDEKSKKKVLVCFIAAVLLSVPFCVVSPVGGRCFVCVDFLCIVALGEYFRHLNKEKIQRKKVNAFAVILAFVLIFDAAGYATVNYYTHKKIETITAEAEKGSRLVTLQKTKLGFLTYGVDTEPYNKKYMRYFCDYYDLPEGLKTQYK